MPPSLMASQDNVNLKRILDDLKINYWLTDFDFILLDVNDTFLEFAGASRTNLIGRDVRTLISVEEIQMVEHYVGLLKAGRKSVQFELYVYGPRDREKIPVLFHLSLNTDGSGRPKSVNILLVDISEQKRMRDDLEKEKRMLQSILFGIRDCVSIFDQNGRYMFGSAESSALHCGRTAPLLPLGAKGPVELELSVEGQARQFLGEIRPIYDRQGRLFAHAETLTDITDNVRLAEKERELFHFKRQKRRSELQTEMIGSGRAMEGVFETIVRCAEVDSSVLITGETGVGKEVAARAIHGQSHRKDKPFVAVNCGALPEALLESELFGHVRGAFTGAISDRAGLFREAHEGTLFLDEIGELDMSMQVKLLRVLQERKVRPVGSDRFYPVDVRIISATNRNLSARAQQGQFRLDLYYRVAVIPLAIPPLRERSQDILRLAGHFIDKHQKRDRRHLKTLDMATRQRLEQYPWPGNIRELENAIEHALAMCRENEISPACLPLSVLYPETPASAPADRVDLAATMDLQTKRREREHRAITEALLKHEGNLGAVAEELGISRVTLWRKRKKWSERF
ncbi:MAG: sigma 54-interacting transcriptional regulator [Desulfobacterales bacterium]|nr:sigma 54-interacting transcriptional regulator [Desulfobacterales bacterium]